MGMLFVQETQCKGTFKVDSFPLVVHLLLLSGVCLREFHADGKCAEITEITSLPGPWYYRRGKRRKNTGTLHKLYFCILDKLNV